MCVLLGSRYHDQRADMYLFVTFSFDDDQTLWVYKNFKIFLHIKFSDIFFYKYFRYFSKNT